MKNTSMFKSHKNRGKAETDDHGFLVVQLTLKDSGHCRCATLSCFPLPIIHMMECVGKFKGHLPVKISYRIVL